MHGAVGIMSSQDDRRSGSIGFPHIIELSSQGKKGGKRSWRRLSGIFALLSETSHCSRVLIRSLQSIQDVRVTNIQEWDGYAVLTAGTLE